MAKVLVHVNWYNSLVEKLTHHLDENMTVCNSSSASIDKFLLTQSLFAVFADQSWWKKVSFFFTQELAVHEDKKLSIAHLFQLVFFIFNTSNT